MANRLLVTELCARLESPSGGVRISALAGLRAMAIRGDNCAVVEVVNRLQHPVKQVRQCALQVIDVRKVLARRKSNSGVNNFWLHFFRLSVSLQIEAIFLHFLLLGTLWSILIPLFVR